MYMRIFITKFPDKTKAKLFLSIWKTDMLPTLKQDSKILEVSFLDIGEGKLLAVAKYSSEDDFQKTNKWLYPLTVKNVKALDGIVESIPGNLIIHWNSNSKDGSVDL